MRTRFRSEWKSTAHRASQESMVLNDEWSQKVSLQDSSPPPCPRPSPTPLTSGACAVQSQSPLTWPQPSRSGLSHTPGMSSSISGPLCSCIPLPEFFPHPASRQAFGKWTECKEKPVPSSPSSSYLPYRHVHTHTRTRTHTHMHVREAWLGFHKWRHKLPNRYNSGFILRSSTPGPSLPSCFPRESVLGPCSGAPAKTLLSQPQGRPGHCRPEHLV